MKSVLLDTIVADRMIATLRAIFRAKSALADVPTSSWTAALPSRFRLKRRSAISRGSAARVRNVRRTSSNVALFAGRRPWRAATSLARNSASCLSLISVDGASSKK